MSYQIFPIELAVACAVLIAVLCLVGLVSGKFKDNWAQHLGLGIALLWAASEAWTLAQHAWVLDDRDLVSLKRGLLHSSLALYAVGTAWKVWKHRKHQNGTR